MRIGLLSSNDLCLCGTGIATSGRYHQGEKEVRGLSDWMFVAGNVHLQIDKLIAQENDWLEKVVNVLEIFLIRWRFVVLNDEIPC